ncbi:Bug family tripartite tricarboxylate transporter substrate binding protein [Enterovirga rhinocerotis]|uniref:Tripartite-type tricarboxylate transporter receptor subunit TctC n=1 Tax=Enterovirga rhinocerotis TaxID=1339210 RepID=A0A4R7C9D9_9HYPH|nr:tripartite tricarboxylate transporter substrate binding protein [Enterovirga rhinocerotis]TDR93357.1 tripartite-type tricarboxylate transporter receptor subunit TctC [Enterovirga rhinocerotis]
MTGRFFARLAAACSLTAALLAAPVVAEAQQAYPSRTIRLVVGFPAGGPTDGPARIIADKLRTSLGQPVVVENKPGAGGAIAVADVLSQPRDGYSLLLCTYIDPINTVLLKNVSYKIEDLQPISQVTKAYYGLAVDKALPVNSVAEFVAYAKERPGKLNYGHVGVGSAPELIAREFELLTGIKMTGVPFRGTGPALQEMVAGRLDFLVGPLVVTMPLVEAKQIKLLAMTSPERLAIAPDVPTLTEQGVKLVSYGWLGVCGGSGLPTDVVALLNRHVREAVASPEYQALMKQTGVLGVATGPEEFGKVIAETAAEARTLATKLGIPTN